MTSDRTMRIFDASMRVCGATIAERLNAARVFKQAMSTGVLHGDNFRFLLENNSYLCGMVAEHLETTIGDLRRRADRGELTAELVTRVIHLRKAHIVENSQAIPESYAERAAECDKKSPEGKLYRELVDILGGMSDD